MGRTSVFSQLPQEVLADVDRLIRAGRTIQQIRDHLAELDIEISNGAAGRYVKNARAIQRRYREAQEIAGQWVGKITEEPRGDVSLLLAEMLKTVAFTTLDNMAGEETADGKPQKPAKPSEIMMLAKAIQSLESTAKASMERRARIEKAVLEKAADKAGEVGRRTGVSQATIDEIQRELRLL